MILELSFNKLYKSSLLFNKVHVAVWEGGVFHSGCYGEVKANDGPQDGGDICSL